MAVEHNIIIYIHDEQVYGKIINEGAFVSLVNFHKDGIEYEVFLENDEFDIVSDIALEIEEEF
jgi:hypothetical protein